MRFVRRSLASLIAAAASVAALSVWPCSPAGASGLLVPSDPGLPPFRITDHLVSVSIHDQVALTSLTQTFRNDTNQRLEGTYVFPLPEQADLTNFQMTFNGKMVEGEVLPAEEARDIYEAIVRQSRDPGLIEFIGTRLLRMRVFPIEPNSDTTIKVAYQQICKPISGMTGYHYPLRTSGTEGRAYGTVRFDVQLDSTKPLRNIWSPTHAVEIVRDGDFKATIAYEAAGGSLEQDFILLHSTDSSDVGLSVVAHQISEGATGHFLLLVTPKQLWPAEEYQPQDVVFVIDTSGSMAGDKIVQAKSSLKYCIEQLSERDRFSLVRFSTGFDVLFEDVADANAENKQRAREFVDSFEAAGGTNITDTLVHIAGMKPDAASRPFVVVFLTDGQGNRSPEETMDALARATGEDHRRDAGAAGRSLRIFPFGVGHDVNTILLDRLSNTYHGRSTYVQPGENLELVLGDFFSTISQPVLTNLRLTLPDIGATERFPVTLGDLYHGQQLTIAGQFSKAARGVVKLSATRNGKEVEYTWPEVAFEHTESATYVAPIWAGRKIAWMIDEIRLHGENPELVKEIVDLSMEYGIQTPYTSWLVAPEGRPGDPGTPRPMPMPAADDRVRLRLGQEPMRRINTNAPGGAFPGGGGGSGGGGRGFDGGALEARDINGAPADSLLTLEEAEQAVRESSGRGATLIAEYQSRLRDADHEGAGGRLDESALAVRKIAGVTYLRVGPFLVDESVDEKRELVMVKFGSTAYFDMVAGLPARKALFAAARNVVVPAGEKHALVVVDEAGEGVLEEFSDEQAELFGLTVRMEG
jgi:Ca-activated chloride channel family protein